MVSKKKIVAGIGVAVAVVFGGVAVGEVVSNNNTPFVKKEGDKYVNKAYIEPDKIMEMIKSDSYLSSNYLEFYTEKSDSIVSLDGNDSYGYEEITKIIGIPKDTGYGDTQEVSGEDVINRTPMNGFVVSLGKEDIFDNVNNFSINYSINKESDRKAIRESFRNIVEQLYGKDVARALYENTDREYKTSYTKLDNGKNTSEGGLTFNLKKYENDNEIGLYVDNFRIRDNAEKVGVETLVKNVGNGSLIGELEVFKGVNILDIPRVYADLHGNYSRSRLTHYKETESKDSKQSYMQIDTIYENDTVTSANINVYELQGKKGLDFKTAIRFSDNKEEIYKEALRISEAIVGNKLDFLEVADGDSIDAKVKSNILGNERDIRIKINIVTEETEGGEEFQYYGNVSITTV